MTNARVAKQNKRVGELERLILAAHNELHAENVEGCHEALHKAMGIDNEYDDGGAGKRIARGMDFDRQFRDLCVATGRRAAYVTVTPEQRLAVGGDAEVARMIDSAFQVDA